MVNSALIHRPNKPRRRWPSHSLRTLFVMIIVAAVIGAGQSHFVELRQLE
jgi:hypothetical protein